MHKITGKMRLTVGLLLIFALIACMYLFGLLVTYKTPPNVANEELKQQPHQQRLNNNEKEPSQPLITKKDEEEETHPPEDLSSVNEILRRKIHCDNKVLRERTYQRGSFWVLENYVVAERRHVRCYESVTYTTHTDYTFLDNLVTVAKRWMAPISVALYAPGEDFRNTIDSIFYLRNCLDNQRDMDLIQEFVSFHLYFNVSHMPAEKIRWDLDESHLEKCSTNPMERESFRSKNKIFYPVNVGRNVARDSAATHFVFASDIELIPTPLVVPKFLKMIASEPGDSVPKNRIFPLALYEVDKDAKVPTNKTELVKMLKNGQAIRFHAKICKACHAVPENDKWESTPEGPEMRIFTSIKRTGSFYHWEPIYIGSQEDPYYDERLSWEGKSDKMTQGYILCIQDYTMALLSDAFLTHRPGFKTIAEAKRELLEKKTIEYIKKVIGPEIHIIYGEKKGCQLG